MGSFLRGGFRAEITKRRRARQGTPGEKRVSEDGLMWIVCGPERRPGRPQLDERGMGIRLQEKAWAGQGRALNSSLGSLGIPNGLLFRSYTCSFCSGQSLVLPRLPCRVFHHRLSPSDHLLLRLSLPISTLSFSFCNEKVLQGHLPSNSSPVTSELRISI